MLLGIQKTPTIFVINGEQSRFILKDEGKFEVAIASDEKLSSSRCCKGLCMVLQGESITIELYVPASTRL